MKKCSKCKRELSLECFSKAKTKSGLRARCKECSLEDWNLYVSGLDPEVHSIRRRASKYKQRFKLSLEQVEALFTAVEFRCEACGTHRDDTYNHILVLDHDHSCCPGERTCGECIRGVLCTKCNVALGALNDDPLLVEGLQYYSRRIPWPMVSTAGTAVPQTRHR